MNRPLMNQLWVVCGIFVDYTGHGMVLSYTSCLLPALRADDSPIKLDLASASWIGSILAVSLGPCTIIISFITERYGRRWVHASAVLVDLFAWLLHYWATDFYTLLIARIMAGVSISSSYVCGCLILAEYTSPQYRGIFLNTKSVSMFAGCLISHTLAHYLHWRTVALMGVIPCVIGFLINLTWPESPSWLLSKNRFKECEETFYWLRGRGDKAVKELESMIRAQKLRMSKRPQSVSFDQKTRDFFSKFKQKSFLKPLSITIFASIVRETSGRHFFPSYALDILSQVTNDKANQFFYVILIDVMSLASISVSCILVKVMGRRTLFALSGIPAVALFILLSSILFVKSREILTLEQPWLIPSLVCILFMSTNLGCTAVPLIIFGEIFPLPHRESGLAAGGLLSAVIYFCYLKIMPYLLVYIQLQGTFVVFAVTMTIGLGYLYFVLPETRNRTLQEIEEYFDHGRFLDDEEGFEDVEAKEVMINPK